MDEQKVTTLEWSQLSLNELFEQRSIMYNRYEFLLTHKKEYAAGILDGLNNLDAFIAKRLNTSS